LPDPVSTRSRSVAALATADIDNDGDLDLLVTTNGQDVELLRNDGGNRGHGLLVDLRSAAPNTRAIGARVRATTAHARRPVTSALARAI
jgi:hypothetical protein